MSISELEDVMTSEITPLLGNISIVRFLIIVFSEISENIPRDNFSLLVSPSAGAWIVVS